MPWIYSGHFKHAGSGTDHDTAMWFQEDQDRWCRCSGLWPLRVGALQPTNFTALMEVRRSQQQRPGPSVSQLSLHLVS